MTNTQIPPMNQGARARPRPLRRWTGLGRTISAIARRHDPALGSLSLLLFIGTLMCLIGAVFPPSPRTSVGLHAAFAAIGFPLVAVLWVSSLTVRLHPWRVPILHTGLLIGTALTGVLMAGAATPEGHVLIAFNFVYLALIAAYFLPRIAARAHTAAIAVAILLATHVTSVVEHEHIALVMVTSVVTVAEVLGHLATGLRRLASLDPLTGALNRAALRDTSRELLARCAQRGEPAALVIVDLDDFKQVNDSQGHAAGDKLLSSATGAWRSALRHRDVLARIGGDEFVILLPDATTEQAQDVVQRLRKVHPGQWSSGIASTTDTTPTFEALLEAADHELYAAKRSRPRT